MTYDPEATRAYFDVLADREWDRLEKTVQGRVKYAVHRRLLETYVRPGMRVLDVGCGPGRFAIDIAKLGATVTLVDLSQVQLDLARHHLDADGAASSTDGFHCLDVLDLSSLEAASYDVVVCFGGAISYTRRQHPTALRQLARVARPGAPILASVMSLFGALRLLGPLDDAAILEDPYPHLDWDAVMARERIVYTNPASPAFHQPLALFTSDGLRTALVDAGLGVEMMATSNPLVPEFFPLPRITQNTRATDRLIALEVALCQEPGLIDAGGHLLAVARRPHG